MDHEMFRWLVGPISLTKPQLNELLPIFMYEFEAVKPTSAEREQARAIFTLTFEGHEYTPPRKSGEAYIFHVLRAAVECARDQARHGVKDVMLIFIILLHDTFEEARGPHISPLLLRSKVTMFYGELIAKFVYMLTKHKELGETNEEYMARIAMCMYWIVIVAKFYDRLDNLDTLESMPLKNQRVKVSETEEWFIPFCSQAHLLIQNEIDGGVLSENFLNLFALLVGRLKESIRREKRRLGMP